MQWIKRVFGETARRQGPIQDVQATLIMALEPRMMFDGAAAATVAEASKSDAAPAKADASADKSGASTDAKDSHDSATVAPAAAATSDQRHEVVFINNNVPGYQQLVASAKPGTEVVVLDSTRNGLQQMVDYLNGREGIDAIHVLGHGNVGEVGLGNLTLSEANLATYQPQLAQLGQSLSADGDLMLYGCDVGSGAQGSAFVHDLATATGADVAASSNLTGSASKGGDWTLEVRSGSIEASTPGDFSHWDGLLDGGTFVAGDSTDVTKEMNINVGLEKLGNGNTVAAYLTQIDGDNVTWDPMGPVFDGVVKVLDGSNNVIKTIDLLGDFGSSTGYSVGDAAIKSLTNGGFVVSWSRMNTADYTTSVYYAIYDNSGTLQSSGALATAGHGVSVAAQSNGDFAIAFQTSDGSQSEAINVFTYNGSGFTARAQTLVGGNATVAGSDADTNYLKFQLTPGTLTALSDGSYVLSSDTYDWVSPTYTPLGTFNIKIDANGELANFASGKYWQRVNWDSSQNGPGYVVSFTGGYAVFGQKIVSGTTTWQVTVYNNDGSLRTTTQQTAQVYNNGSTGPRTYYATDIATMDAVGHDELSYQGNQWRAQSATAFDDGTNLVFVFPDGSGGLKTVSISKTTGQLVGSATDSGITVPAGGLIFNPRYVSDGAGGYDITYSVLFDTDSSDGDRSGYAVGSVYQIGLDASPGPNVTDAHISVTSTGTGTGGVYKIGDTVQAVWDNSASGDNQAGVTGVTMDFSAFGGGTAVSAVLGGDGRWTATYTITSGSIDATQRNVSVTATNAAGSTTRADSSNLSVDNQAPTVTDGRISISGGTGTGGAYRIGDTVTATWNSGVSGDNNSDTLSGVTVDFSQFGGGSAVAATNAAGVWTATYTITAGSLDASNRNISVTVTDNAGNSMTGFDTSNAAVDNIAPTVTDAAISISGGSGVGGTYKIGDTVTATWNNSASGDNNSDTISAVTVDFSQFGGGSAVAASNAGGVWTATYTITAGSIDASNRNVSVTVTDNAGNSTTRADSSNASVDNIAPTVTDAAISISGGSGIGGAYKIGDTVTATWNNSAGGDNNSDSISGVTVDFSQFGGGSAVAASNSSGVWTATYTITAGSIDASNRNISITATDNAGNSTTRADTSNAGVDSIAPTVTDAAISISGGSGAGGTYKIGDTVTATWNNSASGDNNSDSISGVTVDFSQFGGGSAVVASNAGGVWTATYTITAGSIDAANRNVSVTVTDNAGNSTAHADTSNASVDNIAPTVTDAAISISGGTGNGGAYKIGDTVTATWNNSAGGDNNSDTIGAVTVDFSQFGGGSAVVATNSSGVWTATYTITAGSIDASNRNISVTVTDNAGNSTTRADTSNASVDNIAPAVTDAAISISGGTGAGGSYTVGDTVTVTWNNGASGDNNSDTIGAVTVDFSQFGGGSAVAASNSSGVWTASYTLINGVTFGANKNVSVTATDNAGNATTIADTTNATIANAAPVVTTNAGSAAFVAGDNMASTPVAVDSGLTVSDRDGTTLASATVSITGNFQAGEDVLSFTNGGSNMGNIIGSYNAATGVLTLTSAGNLATLAQWQAALRSVTYTDTAVTPNSATRTVSFSVDDGASNSTVATRTVTVADTDQTPILSTSGSANTFVKGGSAVTIDSGLSVADLDNTTLASAVVAVSGNFQSGDVLVFTNTSAVSFGNIVASYDASTGELTMTSSGATATLAQWRNALSAVTFASNSASLSSASRTISFAVNDGTKSSVAATQAVNILVNPSVQDVSSSSANGTYKVGDTVYVSVTFDQTVNVDTTGGAPNLLLETGSTDRRATYVSGSGSNVLTFAYTVQAGDQSADLDFASTAALSLNGATIRSASNDDAILTLAAPGVTHSLGANKAIVIDGVAPTVSSVSVPANGTYVAGQNLDFTVSTSEVVVVDTTGGEPRLLVTVGSQQLYADYLSGSGSSALTFRLTVATGELDTDGIAVGSLDLNGATVRDAAGNDAVTTLNSVASTAGVKVDAVAPTISSVSVPANGTYVAGQNLDFTVNTSESVLVDTTGGTPRLLVTVGSQQLYANYLSGSGTGALTFRLTVASGELDTDGIAVGSSLDLNGGTVRDAAGNDAVTTLNAVGATTGVKVDAVAPTIGSVSVPANGLYKAGDTLSFTVNTDEAVLIDTTGGTPRLALTIGSSTVYANYLSGSGSTALVFQYQVQAGNNDADGITVGALQANGGTLRDAAGNDATLTLNSVSSTASVLVDTTAPTVGSVSVPANGTYVAGQNLDFTVSTSEAVVVDTTGGAPRLLVTVGSQQLYADYLSGSGTNALTFRLTVASGELDTDGIAVGGSLDLNGATVRDAAGNDAVTTLNSMASTAGVKVDAVAPTVSSVNVPASGDYKAGDLLSFTVNASEDVLVDTTGGTPRLALDIGGRTVYADYVSGSGSSALVFQYQVQAGDNDGNGIAVSALQANGATLRDAAGNDANTALASVRDTQHVLVDTTAPTANAIVRVDASPSNAGTANFDVSFAEKVDGLDAASFVLQTTGSVSGQILSVTRLGDQTWRVTVGNLAGDGNLGIALRADSRVHDAAGNVLQQGLQGPAYALDHSSPQISGVQLPADGRYSIGQTLQFSVGYNEAVVVDTSAGVPRIAITLAQGGTVYANYVSGSGTNQLVFAYTVQAGQADNDGIQLGNQILANGGRLTDAVGNAASLALGSLPATAGLLVQGSVSEGDPQHRAEQGLHPLTPAGSGTNSVPMPSTQQLSTGVPVLGQPPLLDSRNLGQAQTSLSGLFSEGPAQSQFALVFSSANGSSSGAGFGGGMGFLGFGGGDAGVFGSSTLSSVFSAAQQGTEEALSAFDRRGGNGFGELHGAFATPGLGQQLHEMNQREQRQVADLARALGELGQELPAS